METRRKQSNSDQIKKYLFIDFLLKRININCNNNTCDCFFKDVIDIFLLSIFSLYFTFSKMYLKQFLPTNITFWTNIPNSKHLVS